MRNLFLMFVMVFGMSLYAFAQSSPAASPVPAAVASAPAAVVPVVAASPAPAASVSVPAPAVSAGFIGIVVAIVAGLNVLLSGVQTIFGNLSKSEPGWLQTVSSIVASVAKWLGSNPSV